MRGWSIPKSENKGWLSPHETSTGVILPIWTSRGSMRNGNKHHPHFLERDYLGGSPEDRALRFSRLQKVNVRAHDEYHDFISGTQKPETGKDAFRIILLNAAQYIPKYAVNMTHGVPDLMALNKRQRGYLGQHGSLSVQKDESCRRELGDFLNDHPVTQSLVPEERFTIEEYTELLEQNVDADKHRQSRLRELGKDVINIAIEATMPEPPTAYKRAPSQILAPQTAFSAA